ncbi:MAG: DUF2062 domain-containing protein [Magnetococcales bacterium]|nr:DUF2062 domain-containing protein [Magnetococcales bacterium]
MDPSPVTPVQPSAPPMAAPCPTPRPNRPTGWRRWLTILRVNARRNLITPILRGTQDPAYFARASAVGFFLNFTPSVGAQIPLAVAMWSVTRFLFPRWDFHLGVACAWTLLTSVPTVPPMYYTFIVTGRLMLGRWNETNGFDLFSNALNGMQTTANWWDSLWLELTQLWDLFGLPLFVGSLPWGIGTAWISYFWTLRLIQKHRQKRLAASHPL